MLDEERQFDLVAAEFGGLGTEVEIAQGRAVAAAPIRRAATVP